MRDQAVPCTVGQEMGRAKKRQGCNRTEHSIFPPSLGSPHFTPRSLEMPRSVASSALDAALCSFPSQTSHLMPIAQEIWDCWALKTWFLTGYCLVMSFDANSKKASGALWRSVEIRKQSWAFPRQTWNSKVAQSWVGSSTCSHRMGYSALGVLWGEGMLPF